VVARRWVYDRILFESEFLWNCKMLFIIIIIVIISSSSSSSTSSSASSGSGSIFFFGNNFFYLRTNSVYVKFLYCYNFNVSHSRHVLNVDLEIFRTWLVEILIIYLHTTFHIPSFITPLVITVKLRDKWQFSQGRQVGLHSAKFILTKVILFSNIGYHT
jgi:hypothetical protein